MSIFTILTLIFLILKLTHYIDWNWFFVLSPMIAYLIGRIAIATYCELKGIPYKLR